MIPALLLIASLANAEDLSKATRGTLLSTDCDAELCHSYDVEVSKKFVRMPIARQLQTVSQFCGNVEKLASDYQDEDGHEWTIDSCIFRYHGRDIIYRDPSGRAVAEPWYVAALAALRD